MESPTPITFTNNNRIFEFLSVLFGSSYDIIYYRYTDDNSVKNPMDRLTIVYSNKNILRPQHNPALQEILEKKIYIKRDYIANIPCELPANKHMRTSFFFVKDKSNILSAILAISHDTKPLIDAVESLLTVCNQNITYGEQHSSISETIAGIKASDEKYSPEDLMLEALSEELSSTQSGEKLTQHQKQIIFEKLYDRGVFLVKGAVTIVAQTLDCSEATIYRHIAKMDRK